MLAVLQFCYNERRLSWELLLLLSSHVLTLLRFCTTERAPSWRPSNDVRPVTMGRAKDQITPKRIRQDVATFDVVYHGLIVYYSLVIIKGRMTCFSIYVNKSQVTFELFWSG